MKRPSLEVADVIVAHAPKLLARGPVAPARRRVLADLAACRTSILGGHVDECQSCGDARVSYNSCRNRHCPKCQGSRRAAWVAAQEARLLPVPYFHVVFTLPEQIAEMALQNKRELYGLLFRASAETLQQVARDRRRLGGEIGFVSLLHTWSQTLQHHPHVHVVVAGGGLSADGARWIACRPGFFLPVRVLGRVFRGKFLAGLEALRRQGRLRWQGRLEDLRDERAWRRRLREVRRQWVVYAKSPFGGVDRALRYLARYTHRVAISNERLLSLRDGVVAFRYRDSAHGNRPRTMRLDAVEFLRRFLLHVLPKGFPKVRSYGFLANRSSKLERCRELLGVGVDPGVRADDGTSPVDEVERRCPTCGSREIVRRDLPKRSAATAPLRVGQVGRLDSS